MNSGRTVFAQLIEHLSHKEFQKCVARYGGDRYAKNFSCWNQYLAMAFAQLTYRESLRDIEICLRSPAEKTPAELGLLIHIEAFDWNCQQHITRRYTEEELAKVLEPVRRRIDTLE